MKTYSVATKRNDTWFTNWYQYFNLDDIDWKEVEAFCVKGCYQAYGYYYGHNSRNLTSSKCRTVVKELDE